MRDLLALCYKPCNDRLWSSYASTEQGLQLCLRQSRPAASRTVFLEASCNTSYAERTACKALTSSNVLGV